MSIQLSRFEYETADTIAAWPTSAVEARVWAGAAQRFPVTAGQLRQWHSDPDVSPFVAYENNKLIAYGELWIDHTAQEVEIARVIVRPEFRNAGTGKLFVKLLVERAKDLQLPHIYVRVVPTNIAAIRCYESAGFISVSNDLQEAFNKGQPYNYVWLQF